MDHEVVRYEDSLTAIISVYRIMTGAVFESLDVDLRADPEAGTVRQLREDHDLSRSCLFLRCPMKILTPIAGKIR